MPHPLPIWTRRLKALIVDLFMLYVPLLYLEGYLLFDSLAQFRESVAGPMVATVLYLLIASLFVAKTGQTPGKRAYDLRVERLSGGLLSWPQALWRQFAFLLSAMTVVGLFLPFFRADRRALHDILSASRVVEASCV
ncbi:MAG: RDD family protein [Campylobacterales bacterium]